MNWPGLQIEGLVQTPAAAALGRTLLHSLWEGATVTLVLAMVLCLAKSSRVRYGAACLALVTMLAGIVITFARLFPSQVVYTPPPGAHFATHAPAATFTSTSTPIHRSNPGDSTAWLAPFWIVGVLLFQTRSIFGWLAARRLRRTGVCCAPALWQTRMELLGARLRVTKPVALLESCLAEVPVVIGCLRPIVLVPVGLLTGLPEGQVEAILLHELAHIRRYDYLVNLLQLFVEGVLFYHPGVWWISNVMRTERENCCDDLVVAATGGPLEYATALTVLEGRRVYGAATLAATGGRLVDRIRRLLGHRERRYAGFMPVLTAAILTVSVLTAMTALQPPRHKSAPTPQLISKPLFIPQVLIPQAQISQLQPAPSSRAIPTPPQSPVSQDEIEPDTTLLDRAQRDIENARYLSANLTLNTLIHTYPDSKHLEEAEIALAYSQMRNQQSTSRAQYKKWLDDDVAYIISDEERKAFAKLDTDPDRRNFVDQFWLRRDPTPGTEANEFKQEIDRRIDYANAHFEDKKGTSGWRTDRGRIYIQYGPPDAIDAHSTGGSALTVLPGGGLSLSSSVERWRYKHIDGIGDNAIFEFVDSTQNNEFKLTITGIENDTPLRAFPILPAQK